VLFFFRSIILAFTRYRTAYFILILSAVPPRRSGSMAAPSPPSARPQRLHLDGSGAARPFVTSFIACDLYSWGQPIFFSSFNACDLTRSWRCTQIVPCPRHYGSSSGPRHGVASSSPLRPLRTSKVMTNENRKHSLSYSSPPHRSASAHISASLSSHSLSSHSLSSHSEASLASSSASSATSGPDVLPTSVFSRKSRTA